MIEKFHTLYTSVSKQGEHPSKLLPLVEEVEERFPKSVVLQFYIGNFLEMVGRVDQAIKKYKYCIQLCPEFSPPYLAYANLAKTKQSLDEMLQVEKYLLSIFCKQTFNGENIGAQKSFSIKENLFICIYLGSFYIDQKAVERARYMYETMDTFLKASEYKGDDMHAEIENGLAMVYTFSDMERAHQYCTRGLKRMSLANRNHPTAKALMKLYLITRNYVIEPLPVPFSVDDFYRTPPPSTPVYYRDHPKIRIGYISSDLNRNAVSLFASVLFSHHNRDRFELYCFYNNEPGRREDFVTDHLKTFVEPERWFNIWNRSDHQVFDLIQYHEIDILVDLNGHAYFDRVSLMSMRPAPVQINYLGYPGFCEMEAYDYCIRDHLSEPVIPDEDGCENVLYLPRSFLCFQPFVQFDIPPITVAWDRTIKIGVMNKISKHNRVVFNIWKKIAYQNQDVVFYFKLNKGETLPNMYNEIPHKQMVVVPFDQSLTDYYKRFNQFDFCVDTFPYSGTATTCSSLLMGHVPVCIYHRKNRHASNVSGSILKHLELDHLVCSDPVSYDRQIRDMIEQYRLKKNNPSFQEDEVAERTRIRDRFMKWNEPNRFIQEYETVMEKLLKK